MDSKDIVGELLTTPFSRRSFNEKVDIVKKGRPTPHLQILTQAGKGYVRHFQASNWERYPWLTGSVQRKKLFCWDCLLFSTSDSSVWSNTGFDNLSCLTKAAQKHQNSAGHLKSVVLSKTFGDARIDLQLNEQRRRETEMHNERVRKNRQIWKRLIDCVIFLGKQELPFSVHDEGRESANRGNYLELLSFLAEYDKDLHYHLSTSKVFTGTSGTIQNDLINAVAEVIGKSIKDEIKDAAFTAVMLDQTDVSNTTQLSLVLRYVTENGVKERFVKFEDVTKSKWAHDIAEHVMKCLEEFECVGKVVAQCYDGAAVMASGLNGVQAKVKDNIPQALFIHCYAHTLNLVMSQGVAKIRECKIFFSHLTGLAAFFSKSPERTQLFDEICQKKLPRVAPTRWNLTSRLVCTVFEKKDTLKDVFKYIIEHHEDFEHDTIHSADGYLSHLENFGFNFFLLTFKDIFGHADVLFDILQNKCFDMHFCLAKVEEFCTFIEQQREHFDQIYDATVAETGEPNGRRTHTDARAHYRALHEQILHSILNQVQDRFKDHEKLSFLSVLDPQQFSDFKNSFPDAAFSCLADSFGPHFDLPRLKTELSVMYSMNDFQGKSPTDLHIFLQRNGLSDSMRQLFLLTSLILTIPVSTAVESTFSALERIKTYTKNTSGQSIQSTLASIAIEKELVLELKGKKQLYDRVIEQFVQNGGWRMDFVFK